MHWGMGIDKNNMVFTLSMCLDTLSVPQCMASITFENLHPGMQNSKNIARKQNSIILYPTVRDRLIYWLHVTTD